MALPIFIGAICTGGASPFFWDGSTSYTRSTIGASTVTITFDSDGGGSNSSTTGTFNDWWVTAPDAGVGTGKYVKAVQSGGSTTLDFLTEDTWYQLNVSRVFGVNRNEGPGTDTWSGTFQFSWDGVNTAYTSPTISLSCEDLGP